MLQNADLTLYDRDGQLIAVIEIKNKPGTSNEWAAKLRRNILAHGRFRPTDFFLVVTPDKLYIWKEAGIQPDFILPTYVIDAKPIFKTYLKAANIESDTISSPAFELVVGAWLGDLILSENNSSEAWLIESGLLDAAKNGRVEYEAAA